LLLGEGFLLAQMLDVVADDCHILTNLVYSYLQINSLGIVN
jgi:hypothetical protein